MENTQHPIINNTPSTPITAVPSSTSKTHNYPLFIAILAVVALAGVGFGIYEYLKPTSSIQCQTPNNTTNDNASSEISSSFENFNDAKAQKLVSKFTTSLKNETEVGNRLDFTDEYKWAITFYEYKGATSSLSVISDKCAADGMVEYSYSYEEANKVYKNLFGSDSNLPKVDEFFKCGVVLYKDNQTAQGPCGCGGSGQMIKEIYQRYKIEGEQLSIFEAVVEYSEESSAQDWVSIKEYEFIFGLDSGNIVLKNIVKL